MRHQFDATGTIGKLPCEVNLNKILAKIENIQYAGKIITLLSNYRKILKQLRNVDAPTKGYLVKLVREDTEQRLSDILGTPVRGVPVTNSIASHAMCCLAAYTRNEKLIVPKVT